LTVMTRAHDGRAECCLNLNIIYEIGVNCEFYMKCMQKCTSPLKLVVIFSPLSLHWNCAKNI